MNAECLLAHFERISEAPDAIVRLRRFILDLAVRGKLVEQDPEDEPAAELLAAISSEPQQVKGRRKASPRSAGQVSEGPFGVPSSWAWTQLGAIGDWGSGSTPSRGRSDYYGGATSWFKSGELNDIKCLRESEEKITHLALEQCSFRLNSPGDVLIAMYGATIGKIAILGEEAVTNQAVCACTPCWGVDTEYLYLFLLAQRDEFRLASEGGAQPNISKVKIVNTPIPLPPLAEQHRIVAKVDELMALCDQLEAARQQGEQGRERLVAATLQRLNQPGDDLASFRQDTSFALQVLPSLTTTPAQIKQLRQTILNLAVRGKLVEQDPEDEDKTALARLIEFADESCSLIPESWLYVPLTCLLDEDTRNGYSRKPDDAEAGFPILRISAGTARQDGLVDEGEFKLISGIDEDLASQYAVKRGDLLACRFNGNKAYVGRLSLFIGYSGKQFIYPDKLIRVRLSEWLAEPSFFRWISNSDLVREEVEEMCATTVGNWGISAGKLKTCMFPLPPLAEQHRIVAKVDELMALCDQLEQQLSQADQQRMRLLEAVLAEALGGRLPTEQEESHAVIA
jgi:type I restriction enzyme S subunit